ncbi:MAG: N-acetylmuramoyl-L-alanine amidase [Armatimonadota bacterium]|nr:N-acetylmuramoyl-L-alanine amidase [Armatimonadota bacterium]MDR7519223.1 N-acetylmuramoyl-L-alanine amidase [Armatimonadota bacterium]MDR7550316.1 N-acetylmuramoyl-L-alanine amidase [Armatimonadota bacterium]
MLRIVPDHWMPPGGMQRVITHWTGGLHHASQPDREHYHILVEGDGGLVRGDHPIDDNASTADQDYAAHTSRLNTGSIGIAVCCMAGAMMSPFRPGQFPMTREQYEALALAVADLCERYGIAVTPQTVLGHGEVEAILGIRQAGKWDPLVLPWDSATWDVRRTGRQVGDAFRRRVGEMLDAPGPAAPWVEQRAPVTVIVDGQPVSDEGIILDAGSWVPLRPIADAFRWTILRIDQRSARIRSDRREFDVIATIRGDRGYVRITELTAALGWSAPAWDPARRTVRIATTSAGGG